MVTETKSGYWRINPETGEAEWIEGQLTPPEIEPIPVPAPTPKIDVAKALESFDISFGGKVVPPTALPAKVEVAPGESPITTLFRRVYARFGETETEFLSDIDKRVRENSEAFLEDLRLRGRTEDTVQVLRMFSAESLTEEMVSNFFQGQPEITPQQNLLMKALPLIVRPTTIAWATKYFGDKPDTLRRNLITAGRNPDTEALVKSLYPQITDRGIEDYFSARVPGMELLGQLPTLTWLDKVKEIIKDPEKLVPFASSAAEMVTLGKLMLTAKDLEDGKEVGREDLLALKEYVERATKDTTWGYEVADVIAQVVPFAGEFIATGGIFTAGKTAVVKAGQAALKRIATRTGLKVLEGRLAKLGVEAVGITVGGTLQAPVAGITRIPVATLEKQLQATLTGDEESVFQSATKAFGEQWVEVVSESTGGLFAPLAAPIKGQLVKLGLFRAFQKANPGKSVNDLRRIMEKAGYHGVLGEMLEERVADVGHGILEPLGLSDQKFSLPSVRQLTVELVAFSVPGAAMTALQTAPILFEKLSPSIKKAISEAAKEERGAIVPGAEPGEVIPPEVTIEQQKQALIDYWTKQKLGKSIKLETWDANYIRTEYELLPSEAKIAIPKAEAVPAVAEVTPPITEITPTGDKITSAYTEAPTPTEGATARVFSRIQTEPAETGFVEKVKQGWHKFNIKMVDDLDPIKQIVDQLKKGDIQLSIDENPYLLARLLRGVTSKATTFLEYGTFGKNFYKVDKQGKASPNYTGESLQNILNEVKDPEKWRDFSTYLTARRAVELSARDIETGIEVNDAQASIVELETKYPQFEGLAQRVYKYQDSLLVYANEMGLLSKDMLGKLRKYGNYVPFYRVFNELQAKGLFGKKMANVANPIKRIKGSEREIINPLESIVKNTYVLVNAADRNQVGIAIANLVDKNPELADVFERVKTPIARVARVSAKELGVEVEGLTEAEEEQMVDIFRPSFFVRGDEVTVLIDGKKNYYRVDADLRDSLLRLDRESLGLLGKWLGAPARWLRAGATLSPDFMFRNPARDQMTAFAYSNYGFMPGIDFVRGLASMLRKDADYQLFRMSGAEHSMLVSMDRSYLQKTFKQIVEGKGFTEYVKHPMELLRIVSEMGEKATRLGEFKKGIQSGAVPLEAGYSARSVTLDFAQAGTTAQAINTFIAFFNANLRGWGKMISSFKEQPIRTSAKVFLGITLPSILLWAVNHDDDRWKEIPQWQKDLFWIVFVGDNIYRIPKPFELGIIFGSVPERFLDWLVDKDPDLMKDLAQTLMEAGSPGFIPTAGLPIIEWMTNYSFFRGRAIVPKSRQAMPPELQYTPWTSEVSKKLGELLKLPPAQIDNLMFAWTGGLGRYATDILDGILKRTGISPDIPEPSPTLADIPVIKAFVVRNPYGSSSEAVNDFYNFLEKYEAGEKYLKEMLILGELEKYNKYKAAHPELFFFADFDSERYKEAIEKGETPKDVYYSSSARYLRRVASQLSELGKKEDLIYKNPDMSPEKKRELIDKIEILKTDIARKAVDLLQQKEPPILQERVKEVVGKLGQVIEEATPLSLEKPDIFTVSDAYREFDSILEGATTKDLEGLKGIDPLALAYIRKEEIEKTLEPILNKQIKDIDFNLKEGVSFEDYYKQWGLGLIKDSPLEKISRRQVELLRKFEASDNKKAFLKSLTDEERDLLNENPQKTWLKSHPTENAEWALAGKAQILTKATYTEFKKLIKKLDIPDSAIPDMTLPPEGSIDTHFTREDMVAGNKDGSWEDQLLLKQDYLKAHPTGKLQAGEPKSYLEWKGLQLPDTPIASLAIKTEKTYRGVFNKLEDEDDPDWVGKLDDTNKTRDKTTGLTDRDRKRAELQATKIGDMTYIDLNRKVKAIERGTEETPIAGELVNAYVSHYQIVDKTSGGSAEAKLNRYDNSGLNDFMMNEDYWGKDKAEALDEDKAYLDNYLVPRWRIDVKYRKEDAAYQAILDKYPKRPPEEIAEAKDYLAKNEAYRKDNRRREAYGLTNSLTGEKLPTDQVESYVGYMEILDKPGVGSSSAETMLYRVDNRAFNDAMIRVKGWKSIDESKIREWRIEVQFQDLFNEHQNILDTTVDIKEQNAKIQKLFAENPAFQSAYYRHAGYKLDLSEKHTENYVTYMLMPEKGWAKERYLKLHFEFYLEIRKKKGWKTDIKWEEIPSEKVEALWFEYATIPSQLDKRQQDFRIAHPDLDAWLVLTGKVKRLATEERRRTKLTKRERMLEDILVRQVGFEKRIAELRKKLGGL